MNAHSSCMKYYYYYYYPTCITWRLLLPLACSPIWHPICRDVHNTIMHGCKVYRCTNVTQLKHKDQLSSLSRTEVNNFIADFVAAHRSSLLIFALCFKYTYTFHVISILFKQKTQYIVRRIVAIVHFAVHWL